MGREYTRKKVLNANGMKGKKLRKEIRIKIS